jgi:tetratricopeptide (TPR) repeat protein
MRAKTLSYSAVAVLTATFAAADTSTSRTAPATDLVQKAEVLTARRDWTSAIAAYEKAIKEQPKDAALRNQLGICYQNAGEGKKARKAYKAAIALRKDYAEAWNNLGTLEHSENHYEQAIAHYTRATALKPQSAATYRNLGAAWAALGDLDKAFAAWSEAYKVDPNFLESPGVAISAGGLSAARQYYLFAKLFAARGQTDDALAYVKKALALGFTDFAQIEGDRDFAILVADPRYAALK